MSQSKSRRLFLLVSTGSAVVGAMQLSMPALAQAKKFTRHSVATAQGKKMLEIYARGVALLMDETKFPQSDPRSWLFQWYTHSVRSDLDKAQELKRIFKSAGPGQTLATAMWDTCEAHTNSARENFFLPWHRAYVAYFEKIIRKVTGEAGFALPYWDYTDVNQRILPEQFRKKSDPLWGALYRVDRKVAVNAGSRIDTLPGAAAITLNALKSRIYGDSADDAGFCANVDGDPHGSIHVDVGNPRGMGSVPWAANDPIFWLHHCNIDRLWASWNKEGGRNPNDTPFLKESFTFADEDGNSMTAVVRDFLDTKDYDYDALAKRPPGSAPFGSGMPLTVSRHAGTRIESGPIRLGGTSLTVDLAPDAATVSGDAAPMFAKRLETLASGKTLYLRLEGVTAKVDPRIAYDVYLGGLAEVKPNRDALSFVGPLTFFGAGHDHHHGGEDAKVTGPDMGRNYSFVVSDATRKLLSTADVKHPRITLIPTGELPSAAEPSIRAIVLVSS